jgi:osmotically inducible protein OsmC
MKRNATAVWNGSLKEGTGKTTQNTTLNDTQYSFKLVLKKA